jgi:hypothetical protein
LGFYVCDVDALLVELDAPVIVRARSYVSFVRIFFDYHFEVVIHHQLARCYVVLHILLDLIDNALLEVFLLESIAKEMSSL